MKIYEIIAEKVCHTICHMNYDIVVNQAKMEDDETFMFTLNDDTEVYVVIWPGRYFIHIDDKLRFSENWGTHMSLDDIADSIISNLKSR